VGSAIISQQRRQIMKAANRMRRRVLASAGALAGTLALPIRATAQAPIVIKFSHVVALDTPKGKAAEHFKKLAEERTKGRVKVEVYPNSTLYKDREEVEALQLGSVQMLAPSLAKFGPLGVREYEVFDLPQIFDSYAELHKVTQGPIGDALFKKLESKGITGLAYWDNGFKVMSANKPLHKPDDMKGLKVRIQSSKVLEAQIRAIGGIPQQMAFSEVYQALQTGVVDAQENTWSNIYTQKFHEVQKYIAMTDHGYIGYAVIVNKKFWDGLPADIRTALEGAMKDATKYANEIAQKENDDAMEAIRKSGKSEIIKLTPEEKKAWKNAFVKVHKEMEERIGKDLIASIYKETGYNPAS
jgi:C4-dicarboxylate-binding protein DctP